jgi:maleylpyruvate isomerase
MSDRPSLKLYGYWRSSSAWRVRIALLYKGLPFENHPVHLLRDGGEQHTAGYKAINPMSEVPTLELGSGVEVRRLTQSLAILRYLESMAPSPALVSADPFAAARAWQLAEIVNAGTQPLQNAGVLRRVKELGGDDQAWARHFIARGLSALEVFAAESAGAFLVGDSVSVADVCLIPQLYNARRFGVDLGGYPTLTRVEARCVQLPAFVDSHPDRQPDAPPPGTPA